MLSITRCVKILFKSAFSCFDENVNEYLSDDEDCGNFLHMLDENRKLFMGTSYQVLIAM